ncbi:DUF2750 domain-containing protein [Neptuniibacter halophilus]|uniref:DUF2750 domain-containing protein n=1 Tax=Neptuniibacter halophilus TaxID=651666 RepID=UPI002572CF88|nr:DUF2750 domain-containing protein [Neptuniibacter halophilus]
MSGSEHSPEYLKILQADNEQRYSFFINEAATQREIWILTDQYGCVMLNTEDEDCVPVWPDQATAEAWATDEWSECKAEAISLAVWHNRWTAGLEEDGFAVVVFPIEGQDGLVVYPEDLDKALTKRTRKLNSK